MPYLALETVPFVGVFDLDGYVLFVVDLLYTSSIGWTSTSFSRIQDLANLQLT